MTEILKATFARLGLECPANLAPQSLVLLAHRAQGRKVVTPLSCGRFGIAGKTLLVLRSSFEHAWMHVLRPAERVVARMWLAGRTHHVIAASRGTSYRTVVNHLSAVYRRLGVSGRLELARACVAHSAVATARRPPRIAAELGETRSSVIFAST